MANTALKKVSLNVVLDNGTDSWGNSRTVSFPIEGLSRDNFNADKALAIVSALEPCFSRSIASLDLVQTSSLYY